MSWTMSRHGGLDGSPNADNCPAKRRMATSARPAEAFRGFYSITCTFQAMTEQSRHQHIRALGAQLKQRVGGDHNSKLRSDWGD